MKKKITLVLLIIVAVFALTSCDLINAAFTPVGTWASYNSTYQLYYIFQFNSDATGALYYSPYRYILSSASPVSRFDWHVSGNYIYFNEYSGYSVLSPSYYYEYSGSVFTLGTRDYTRI